MANQKNLDLIKQSIDVWNIWRKQHPKTHPNLSKANLSGANLSEANLSGANLSGANLSGANLSEANLSEANLHGTNLSKANLSKAKLMNAFCGSYSALLSIFFHTNLSGANLSGANLSGANLFKADLRGVDLSGANLSGESILLPNFLGGANLSDADLSDANLSGANLNGVDFRNANLSGANLSDAKLNRALLVETNLSGATLTRCFIYGISAWNVQLEGTIQDSLVITSYNEPIITVDNLKLAQFIYILLNNQEIRDVIDTITSKVVLVLGRFTPERKVVLDALRNELRKHNYSPIVFDFDKPESRDITETVSTLAHMARFVIADITDAKSIPQELMLIVPNLPSVPVQPLILTSQHEYGMFEHFTRYPWVLPVYRYTDEPSLIASISENVIAPAEQKAKELAKG
jgi:uncharacterized protein YjbI with pentapeptide repeats